MPKILVTGITSGLGKFLQEYYQADGWKRGDPWPKCYYDMIIHCAHDREDTYANHLMMWNILGIPYGKLIYISSIDVYSAFRGEKNLYASSKLECESLIRQYSDNYLIVRPSALLGKYMRPNTLAKIRDGLPITVSKDATFGFVRHESLIPYFDNSGTITIAGDLMTVEQIANSIGKEPQYAGIGYKYETPEYLPCVDSASEIQGYLCA